MLDGVNPNDVREALSNIKSERKTNKAASDIASAKKFGDRADDIDQTISDAKQLAERLNNASVRVDAYWPRWTRCLAPARPMA